MGVDPKKVTIVKTCLEEASFKDVKSSQPLNERFVFNDGRKSWELEFRRAFMDDTPMDKLKDYMNSKIIPEIRKNPGKKLYVTGAEINISDRD